MGIVFRQSVKTSLVVALGAVLGALTIWSQTRYVPKHELGFLRHITSNALIGIQLLMLGLNSTLCVFVHRYGPEDPRRRSLITISLAIPLVLWLLGTLIYYVAQSWVLRHYQAEDIKLMHRYYLWLPILTILVFYSTILEQFLGSQMKVAVSAFMREIVLRIFNLALFVLFGYSLINYSVLFTGSILVYALLIVVFIRLCYKTEGFGFNFNFKTFDRAEYTEILHFTWYHYLLTISITLMTYLDVSCIPWYDHSGVTSLAVYGTAVYFISLVRLPNIAMLPASYTVMARAYTDGDMDKVRDVFIRATTNILIPTIGITVLICCNLDNAVMIINRGYEDLKPIFMVMLIGRLADIVTGMNDQILSVAKYYKFNFYVSVVLIVLLYLLLRFLIPAYGVFGAAWGTTITVMVFNVAKFLFVWKKLGIQPLSMNTVKAFLAGIPALAVGYFLPRLFDHSMPGFTGIILDTCLRSVIIVALYLIMLLWLKPSGDLTEFLATLKKDKRIF